MSEYSQGSYESVKILELENRITELNKIIALYNQDKLDKIELLGNKNIAMEEILLEAFSIDGHLFNKCVVTKHRDSDFVNITFVSNETKTYSINMTEKSYLKFWEIIDVFKTKSINTRQFEEQ